MIFSKEDFPSEGGKTQRHHHILPPDEAKEMYDSYSATLRMVADDLQRGEPAVVTDKHLLPNYSIYKVVLITSDVSLPNDPTRKHRVITYSAPIKDLLK